MHEMIAKHKMRLQYSANYSVNKRLHKNWPKQEIHWQLITNTVVDLGDLDWIGDMASCTRQRISSTGLYWRNIFTKWAELLQKPFNRFLYFGVV